jgi:prevent-host-death family protein
MTTITALELRKNLDSIVRRVQAGERIKVTYRSKPAFTLEPEASNPDKPVPGSPEAMQNFLAKAKQHRNKIKASGIRFDPNKSVKELYHEMLDNDPKYK